MKLLRAFEHSALSWGAVYWAERVCSNFCLCARWKSEVWSFKWKLMSLLSCGTVYTSCWRSAFTLKNVPDANLKWGHSDGFDEQFLSVELFKTCWKSWTISLRKGTKILTVTIHSAKADSVLIVFKKNSEHNFRNLFGQPSGVNRGESRWDIACNFPLVFS